MVAGALPYRAVVAVDCGRYSEHSSLRQPGPMVDDGIVCRIRSLGSHRLSSLEEARTIYELTVFVTKFPILSE